MTTTNFVAWMNSKLETHTEVSDAELKATFPRLADSNFPVVSGLVSDIQRHRRTGDIRRESRLLQAWKEVSSSMLDHEKATTR